MSFDVNALDFTVPMGVCPCCFKVAGRTLNGPVFRLRRHYSGKIGRASYMAVVCCFMSSARFAEMRVRFADETTQEQLAAIDARWRAARVSWVEECAAGSVTRAEAEARLAACVEEDARRDAARAQALARRARV